MALTELEKLADGSALKESNGQHSGWSCTYHGLLRDHDKMVVTHPMMAKQLVSALSEPSRAADRPALLDCIISGLPTERRKELVKDGLLIQAVVRSYNSNQISSISHRGICALHRASHFLTGAAPRCVPRAA